MLKRFKEFIIEKNLFQADQKILIAVSGGVDSVVLCHLLHTCSFSFGMAHCNFNLRGAESDQDQKFVEDLAGFFKVEFYTQAFDTKEFALSRGISIQMAAREMRYAWFDDLLKKQGYDFLATAHHASDVLETVLLNLTRGTGIAGFHGIAARKGKTVRPLLNFTKEEIVQYAADHRLAFREDSSNNSDKYHRNLIRHQVVPLLKQLNPGIEATMLQTAEKVSAAERVFKATLEKIKLEVMVTNREATYLHLPVLFKEEEKLAILFYLLQPFGFSWTDARELIKTAGNPSGSRYLSATHELTKDRDQLVIIPIKVKSDWEVNFTPDTLKVDTPVMSFKIYPAAGTEVLSNPQPGKALLDMDKLAPRLTIRPWQQGDRFIPLGMKGSKKISDFLINAKIPLPLKRETLVVTSDNKIVWLVNHRIDDRYKVTPSTKNILAIECVH